MGKNKTTLTTLQEMVKALRHHTDGCTWCKQQTLKTIAKYAIDEAHELYEAIHEKDYAEVTDELGDLLFQVLFCAQIGEELDAFSLDDILENLYHKIKRRNPHVFTEKKQLTLEEIAKQWEIIKAEERRNKNDSREKSN